MENGLSRGNRTFATWNIPHMARVIRDDEGNPADGTQRPLREAWCPFSHPNPEFRWDYSRILSSLS